MNIRTLTAAFFLLLLAGCGNKNCIVESVITDNSHLLVKRTDECNDRKLLEEQEFTKDSTDSLIPNGFHKVYYTSGEIKSISFFRGGKPDSLALHYYENGKIERKSYFANDTIFGPQYYFSENGQLDSIKYYTKNGINWSTIRFNDDKMVSSVDGKLMHVTVDEKNPYFDSLPIECPLLLINEVATIPGAKTDLNMKIKQKDVVLLDTRTTKFLPFYNTYVTGLKYKFDKKGDYEFQAIVTLVDSTSNRTIYRDTSFARISVW